MICGAKTTWSWCLWMGGCTAVAALAVAVALLWNSVFTALLNCLLVLSPGSQTYERWIAPDQPLYFEVFLFNWTNPDKLALEKPRLEQLGPYRFREVRKHVNVTVHHHNSSVSYRTQRSWFFDEETSNGSLTDIVTTINILPATAVFQKRHSVWERSLLAITLSASNSLHVTKTVREMLFDGYEDSLLTIAKYLPKPTDAPIPDKLGWFVNRNNSIDTDGFVEVTSGAGDRPVGEILKWNHHDSLPFYSGKCARMSGSAGEFIQRNLTANSTLTLFVPDLCRTLDLPHTRSGVLDGLEYHRFDMLEQNFDKSSVTTENNCFCNGECKWSGVMNVSACTYDSPTFLSLPHFLYGDPALREAVDGMDPDPEKHSFYFSVEPTLGVPIDVAGRFQFNIYLAPVWSWPNKNIFSDVPNTLFPVFWVQQKVKVMDSIFSELRMVLAIARWGGVPFVVIGLLCAAVVVFCSSKKPKYISISTG